MYFVNPFHAFVASASTVTEATLTQILPVSCVGSYGFYDHLLVVTLIPTIVIGSLE